jgi:large subunit ribosomal protein LP1
MWRWVNSFEIFWKLSFFQALIGNLSSGIGSAGATAAAAPAASAAPSGGAAAAAPKKEEKKEEKEESDEDMGFGLFD